MATRVTIPNISSQQQGVLDAFDDLASDIATPPTSRPLDNAIAQAGQKYCNLIGSAPGLYGDILRNVQGVPSLLCKPYWDKNNYSAPVPTGGVLGGQCNIFYNFFPETRGPSTGWVRGGAFSRRGPFTGVSKTVNGGGSFIDRYTVTGPNVVGTTLDVNYVAGGATRLVGPFLAGVAGDVVDYSCGTGSGSGLQPGQNPPPTPAPYPPGDEPGIDPTGNPFFTVPPIENPGTPGEPVSIPDDPLSPPSGGSDPGPPEAGTPGSTGEGGDAEGDAPEGKELWALRIDINSFPARPNEYAPGVYRGVCYVYMGDENGLDHDPAGAMLRSGQLVLAEKEGLTKYRVTANMGYNLTVTPYWREPRKEA